MTMVDRGMEKGRVPLSAGSAATIQGSSPRRSSSRSSTAIQFNMMMNRFIFFMMMLQLLMLNNNNINNANHQHIGGGGSSSSSSTLFVNGEIIELDLLIDADSEEVHYIRGFLKAPGRIDLSNLTFFTTREPDFFYGDDQIDDLFAPEDDVFNDVGDDNFPPNDTGGGGGDDVFPNEDAVPTESPQDGGEGGGGESGESTDAPTGGGSSNPEPTDAPDETIPNPPPPPPPDTDTISPTADTTSSSSGDITTSAPTSDSTADTTTIETVTPTTDTVAPTTNIDPNTAEPTSSTIAPTTTSSSNTTAGDGDGGGRRRRERRDLVEDLQPPPPPSEGGDGVQSTSSQILDIVLFFVPEDCRDDAFSTCDWATLGVGVPDNEMAGGTSYCCSEDTSRRGLCAKEDVGSIIINHGIFQGTHHTVSVPDTIDTDFVLDPTEATFDITNDGNYILVLANCDDFGMDVIATGDMSWVSVGGYLPGDMVGLMFFYAVLACVYIALALWYYCGMRMYQEAAIPIQKFILATIMLGLFEASFRGLDLFFFNLTGYRNDGLMYTAISLGVLKRGISRCLAVMVAMGWGVVRDSLGRALCQIILLGLIYSGLTLAFDYLVLAAEKVESVNITEEEELLDLALILTPLLLFVNVVFYFWIIKSLNSTTEYLRNMNQTSKLRRHLRLRCLIITSLIVVGIWLLFSVVQAFTGTLSQDQKWILEAVMHVNYLFVLVGVSILWRPNSHAKDYAMTMEIGSNEDGNELELSSNIPSAISDDDMDHYDDEDVIVDRGVST